MTSPRYSSGDDLDGHHRLEQLRLRALHGRLEGHGARYLERHLARVDVVVRPVLEDNANVDDGIAGEDARLHRLLDAEVDRRDVLARDLAADDLVDELVAVPRRRRLEIDDHVPVLAAATGLADKAALDLLRGPAGRLAIGDLRAADVGVDRELAQQPVDDDLQVQLAHARDERLAGLLVGAHGNRPPPPVAGAPLRACPGRPSSWARWPPR